MLTVFGVSIVLYFLIEYPYSKVLTNIAAQKNDGWEPEKQVPF
jgi:hypothetical protein